MDGGFETTGVEPLACLVGPVTVDFVTFWRGFSGTPGDAHETSTEAPLVLKSGFSDTPTHPLNCPEELGAWFEHEKILCGLST